MPAVHDELGRMREFVTGIHEGRITGHRGARFTDVVNIGIGGSDLGIVMATEALRRYRNREIRLHCVSNVDGAQALGCARAGRSGHDAVRGLLEDLHDAGDTEQRADRARLAGRGAGRGGRQAAVRGRLDQYRGNGRIRDRSRTRASRCGTGSADATRSGPPSGCRSRLRSAWSRSRRCLRAATTWTSISARRRWRQPARADGPDRRLEHELPRCDFARGAAL